MVLAISRYMSLGSILVAVAAPFYTFFMKREFFPFLLIIAILIVFKHRSNIVRLAHGNENKFSLHSKKDK